MIGAYIQKIHPSLTMMGEIREGMQVIEWNGIPLTGISHDEVSRIITTQVGDEIEVVIRTDINMMPTNHVDSSQQIVALNVKQSFDATVGNDDNHKNLNQ
ncbi:unnamed protein product, partial [Oppiella nova]